MHIYTGKDTFILIFIKPTVSREPNKAHIPDPMTITGLKSNAVGGGGGGSKYKHPYGDYSFKHQGRKLMRLPEGKSFLENTLTEPIVACGTGT